MKNTYENDEYFRTFVKHATAISSLPSYKLIDGFNYLQEEFNFEEENEQKFKIEFLIYLKEYWIEGPYPPQVWLNFERNQDLTNNNQEATNSRINKDLKPTHPSPMILLCFVYKELRDAEMKAAAAVVGQPRSRQALAHKLMAERRYRLKLNYENDRRLMGVDQKGLLKAYLADMSQNVNSAIMKVHKHQYKVAQGPKHIIENDGD